ncbi:hypothetical protein DFH94DRAFT_405344 [Russula ochroleuca]|uniref:Uncharacterized protein n=1 Tax=Russula ochroleuca TaxID=152965 RepID=A0A9P5TAC0_9AGAM|nr:hypothetical protein DFH94DRAFT_405344 [Russula ochroleuca]
MQGVPAFDSLDHLVPGYTNNIGYDDPRHLATKGPAEQRENQGQRQLYGYGTPGITQCIPSVPGPPLLGQYAPAIPEVTNDGPPSHVPLPQNIAGPSQGNYSVVHSRMSAAEDLKNVASHYLHNPGSHVDKLRMRRSRSGAVQVLILLEIDDAM